MQPTNEPIIYFNSRGEKVPAIGLIRRTSIEVHGVEGPDTMDLIYADPTPEAIGRGDIRECAKIAHSVAHFSHPIISSDGPLANCWVENEAEVHEEAAGEIQPPTQPEPEEPAPPAEPKTESISTGDGQPDASGQEG